MESFAQAMMVSETRQNHTGPKRLASLLLCLAVVTLGWCCIWPQTSHASLTGPNTPAHACCRPDNSPPKETTTNHSPAHCALAQALTPLIGATAPSLPNGPDHPSLTAVPLITASLPIPQPLQLQQPAWPNGPPRLRYTQKRFLLLQRLQLGAG